MRTLSFAGKQPVYLLAAVAHMLRREDLSVNDRAIYEYLRDVLASDMVLDLDVRGAIGLDPDKDDD